MDEIIKKATELGQLIRDSEEMKEYIKKELIFEADEDAQRVTREYNEMREALATQAAQDDITPMEMIEIRKKLGAKLEEVSNHPAIKPYLEAKKAVEDILAKTDSIIKYYVTGEEAHEGGCAGNCSSCGGCH